MQRSIRILLFIFILFGCEEKPIVYNGHYFDIFPDVVLNPNETFKIDMDHDGIEDFEFRYEQSFAEIFQLDGSYLICAGSPLSSGSGMIDTIAYKEVIDYSCNWNSTCDLYRPEIEYIGVRRNTNFQALFGWIRIEIGESTVTIKEQYLSNDPDDIIRAGIKD